MPLWSKNYFLFSFRFWKRVRLTLNWQSFELWVLSKGCFILSGSFGFHGPPLLTFKTDRLDLRWLNLEKMPSFTHQLKISACKRNLLYIQNTGLKVWKPKTPMLHINSVTYIAFLIWWVADVIFSSTQLSQDFKVSNGGRISKKIPVKIKRCL